MRDISLGNMRARITPSATAGFAAIELISPGLRIAFALTAGELAQLSDALANAALELQRPSQRGSKPVTAGGV